MLLFQAVPAAHQSHVIYTQIHEELLDRNIKGGVQVKKPLHLYQFAYRAGMATETVFFQGVHRLESILKYKEIALGAFLGIGEHSTVPHSTRKSGLPGGVGRKKPVVGG
jgi:hypothetical protein